MCIIVFALVSSCIPPEQKTTEVEVDWIADPTQALILELAYNKNFDSLTLFLNHPNATYRYLATSAFESYLEPKAIDSLISRLNDPVPEVVSAAAIALGQIGSNKSSKALISGFRSIDSFGYWITTNQKILEAIGKIGEQQSHDHLATISTYLPVDTALLLGQARGLFYFARRGISNNQGLIKALQLLDKNKFGDQIRTYAAHYLKRSKPDDLKQYADTLLGVFKTESSIEVRIALIAALSKTSSLEAYQYLMSQYNSFDDYRLRVAVLSNMEHFESQWFQSHPFAVQQCQVSNYHIARSAQEFLQKKGDSKYARMYWTAAKNQNINPEISRKLYKTAFKFMPLWHTVRMASMRYELYQSYRSDDDVYSKAQVIESLGQNIDNLQFVSDSLLGDADNGVLQTALSQAFSDFLASPRLPELSNKARKNVIDTISTGVRVLLRKPSVGGLAILSKAMRNANFKSEDWINLLDKRLKGLELPIDYEAFVEVEKTLAYLRGESYTKPDRLLQHKSMKIDSALFEYSQAVVKTSTGTFIMQLRPKMAPYTVKNFVDLAKSGYYNGKSVHRVVSNFVIQTGCGIGDGYGSLDYAIASEFSESYYNDAGWVGMASAGPHTESAQWFVTMAATPHLDGRYSIFAKVSSGMQVVERLEIADKIISVNLIR